jgi:putative mycofactocin binding protein MftB
VVYQLADNVQVRKESWGLLFYSQNQHRLFFVKSGDWLYPQHFEGGWSFEKLAADIVSRIRKPADLVGPALQKSIDSLVKNGMVTHGLS